MMLMDSGKQWFKAIEEKEEVLEKLKEKLEDEKNSMRKRKVGFGGFGGGGEW